MMAARLESESDVQVSSRTLLFDETAAHRFRDGTFDVAPDGRFLMIREEPGRMVFVQNWHEELKRLVPVD